MQQFQVSKNKQIPNPAQLYNQYQVRSPFNNVENKGLIQKTAADCEMMNQPVQPTKNFNQLTPCSSEYKIQFKVGGGKLKTQKEDCDRPFIPMSPQAHEHTQMFQSPQPRYDILQSPQHQIGFQSPQAFQSPQRYLSHVQPSQVQPAPQQIKQQSIVQPTLKKVVNYTNTQALAEELKEIQSQNARVTQEIQKHESEAQRGQSAACIRELEDKIKLLTSLNRKLHSDNVELIKVPDIQCLRDQIVRYQNERKNAYNQLAVIKAELAEQKRRCQEIEDRLTDPESTNRLNDLVQELENKVQTLILENDRINLQLRNGQSVIALLAKQKSENDSIKEKLIKSRKEEERCKQDYLKAEAKYNLFKDCDEKLQLLSDENKRLQQVLNDSELTQNDLESLKEKISVIRQDNQRMIRQLKNKQQ